MTLSQLELLHELADCKSFTRTGKKFGISQPAVSVSIRKLEEELGADLIGKRKKQFSLTPFGESIADDAKEVVRLIEKIKLKASLENGEEHLSLNIGSLESVSINFLENFLIPFKRNNPSIELNIIEGTDTEILNWIKEGTVDFGINSFEDSRIIQHHLVEDEFLFVAPTDHPLAKRKLVGVDDIDLLPFIMPDCGCAKWIEEIIEDKVSLNIKSRAKETASILTMVRENLGFSMIPKFAVPEEFDGVKFIPVDTTVSRKILLGYETSPTDIAQRKFLEYMTR